MIGFSSFTVLAAFDQLYEPVISVGSLAVRPSSMILYLSWLFPASVSVQTSAGGAETLPEIPFISGQAAPVSPIEPASNTPRSVKFGVKFHFPRIASSIGFEVNDRIEKSIP